VLSWRIERARRERAEGFHCFSTVPFRLLFVSSTPSPTESPVQFATPPNRRFTDLFGKTSYV
jgi:hypothetical protein